jgi:hypothetical protein
MVTGLQDRAVAHFKSLGNILTGPKPTTILPASPARRAP